jgi:shikimate dehydrogenase
MQVSGKTSIYGLVGDPVDHSMSPVMQNAAFHSAHIDAVYVTFQVKSPDLGHAVEGLRVLGVKGFNVTTPHKVAVMRYLGRLDGTAEQVGSVNTVKNVRETLVGYSTDGIGAVNAAEEISSLRGKSTLILGAGATARAVAYAFAPKVRSLRILNRTTSRAEDLKRKLLRKYKVEVSSGRLTQLELEKSIGGADIIVNATSMGMEGKENFPVTRLRFKREQLVFEIVYRPLETTLLKKAKTDGAKTLNGLDMLVHQGASSFELWTGKKANLNEMKQAITQKLMVVSREDR